MNELTLRILMKQEGSRSIDALRSLVRQQAQLPGRKTILYVSEGLVVPPQEPELLRSVVSEANRANVSFYTLDARGLDTTSSTQIAQRTTSAILDGQLDEGGQHVQQTDLQQNARQLAAGTGGFAMDNSSDLRAPLRRVAEDVRSHYEVTFSPGTSKNDGRFRSLEVKVNRPGVTVQGRRGYFDLPMVAGEMIAPFEVAALNALNANPPLQTFKFQAAALRFDANSSGVQYELVFSVPSRALKLVSEESGYFRLHVSFVCVIKDERGGVVQLIRRDVPFRAPLARRTEFEEGDVTATAPIRLAPGRYRLEIASLDREADSTSVRKSNLFIAASRGTLLSASDFVWVRTVGAPQADRNASDPLESADGRIAPELNAVFKKSGAAQFYFLVWPSANLGTQEPAAAITITKNGSTVARLSPTVPRLDSTGVYRFTGQIPLNNFEPGQYDIAVLLTQGAQVAKAESTFTVE